MDTMNVLIIVKEMNWNYKDYPKDDWIATVWTVYRNGTLSSTIQKTISGIEDYECSTISEESFKLLKQELKDFNNKVIKTPLKEAKGIGYKIEVYSHDGKLEGDYVGYIQDQDYLINIIRLISKHK